MQSTGHAAKISLKNIVNTSPRGEAPKVFQEESLKTMSTSMTTARGIQSECVIAASRSCKAAPKQPTTPTAVCLRRLPTGNVFAPSISMSIMGELGDTQWHCTRTLSSCAHWNSGTSTSTTVLIDSARKPTKRAATHHGDQASFKRHRSTNDSCTPSIGGITAAAPRTEQAGIPIVNPVRAAQKVARDKDFLALMDNQEKALGLDGSLKYEELLGTYTRKFAPWLFQFNKAREGAHVFASLGDDDNVNVNPWPVDVRITGLPHDTRWVSHSPAEIWKRNDERQKERNCELSMVLHVKHCVESRDMIEKEKGHLARYHDFATNTLYTFEQGRVLAKLLVDPMLGRICQTPACVCDCGNAPWNGALHFTDFTLRYQFPCMYPYTLYKVVDATTRNFFTCAAMLDGFGRSTIPELLRYTPGSYGERWLHDGSVARSWYGFWMTSWAEKLLRARGAQSPSQLCRSFFEYYENEARDFGQLTAITCTRHDDEMASLFLWWHHAAPENMSSGVCIGDSIMDAELMPGQLDDYTRLAHTSIIQGRDIQKVLHRVVVKQAEPHQPMPLECKAWLNVYNEYEMDNEQVCLSVDKRLK